MLFVDLFGQSGPKLAYFPDNNFCLKYKFLNRGTNRQPKKKIVPVCNYENEVIDVALLLN